MLSCPSHLSGHATPEAIVGFVHSEEVSGRRSAQGLSEGVDTPVLPAGAKCPPMASRDGYMAGSGKVLGHHPVCFLDGRGGH